jgi:adenine-specific DNA-methyltransferase
MKVPVHAPGVRNGKTGGTWRGKIPPPGKHWQYTPHQLDEMDARGEISWSANGNPRRKVFLDESKGVGVQDLWLDFKDAHNQNIHITGYPTEKNLGLLARIVAASSNQGDLVLDCFCGSGTSLVAADRQRRKWIGIDESRTAIEACLRRFSLGTEAMGDFVGVRSAQKNVEGPADTIQDFELLVSSEHSIHGASLVQWWAAINEEKANITAQQQSTALAGAGSEPAATGTGDVRARRAKKASSQFQLPGMERNTDD